MDQIKKASEKAGDVSFVHTKKQWRHVSDMHSGSQGYCTNEGFQYEMF